tara:strand:+ start:937 stop:1299 length:363 start_codon:yes stop_codon:yes gene_type:complete
MAVKIDKSTIIKAAGTEGKIIREIIGRVNNECSDISIAHMTSPEGWKEPRQRPDFVEYTYVIAGMLKVETETGELEIRAGQGVEVRKGEWVRYSTPSVGGADYIAICVPAFSLELVNREV